MEASEYFPEEEPWGPPLSWGDTRYVPDMRVSPPGPDLVVFQAERVYVGPGIFLLWTLPSAGPH